MSNLLLVVRLIPLLIDAIRSIEAAIPIQGQGKAKLDAVIAIIESVDQTVKQLPMAQIVSTLVNLFNATGVFKKP